MVATHMVDKSPRTPVIIGAMYSQFIDQAEYSWVTLKSVDEAHGTAILSGRVILLSELTTKWYIRWWPQH